MEVASTTLGTAIIILLLHVTVKSLSGPTADRFLRQNTVSSVQPRNVSHRRLTSKTITTTNCDTVRIDPYPFEMRLLYEYSVEAEGGSAINLDDLEQAIAHAVANELNMCDGLGRPLFSVQTTAKHSFSKTGMTRPTHQQRMV
jgi:hypothetical protein